MKKQSMRRSLAGAGVAFAIAAAGVAALVVPNSSSRSNTPSATAPAPTPVSVAVVERRHGPLGPLLAARAPELEARGLLAPGQREEDIVVVAGAFR